jgi:hypothetical protein
MKSLKCRRHQVNLITKKNETRKFIRFISLFLSFVVVDEMLEEHLMEVDYSY